MNYILKCKDYCLCINNNEYTATPIYYNDLKCKRTLLLFNVTCTVQEGVYVRSYENITIKICYDNNEVVLNNNAMYYVHVDNTVDIEVMIPKTYFNKKIIIKFQLEISRNDNYINNNNCILCRDNINKGKEMREYNSDRTESPTCTANCSDIEYENDYIVNNSSDYCMKCNKGNNRNVLLICDLCKYNVCHTYCDNLNSIPNDEWFCLKCRNKKYLNRKRIRALRLHKEIAF